MCGSVSGETFIVDLFGQKLVKTQDTCVILFLKVAMQFVLSDYFRWPLSLRGQPLQHYQPGQLDFELLLRYILQVRHRDPVWYILAGIFT